MFGSLIVLFFIPFTNTSLIRSTNYRPIFKIFYWLFVTDFIVLMWAGQKPVENIYVWIGTIATIYYFVFFIFLIPIVGLIETKLAQHKVIES